MPSIDLVSLRRNAAELAGVLDQPAAFQAGLRSLLDNHSHRLLRRSRSMAGRSALPAWDVPGLLIRELEAALLPAADKAPDAARAAAAALWPSGKLEEKQLAAFLAGLSRDPGELRSLLLAWLNDTEDPAALQSVILHVCPPLWNSNGVLYRSDVRSWIEHPSPARRRFGWCALRAWVENGSSESAFAAFDLLPIGFQETDPEAIQSASGLLAHLARISPQETRGWLSELTSKSLQQGRRFLRAALPQLPAETAEALRAIQRNGGPP